MFRIGLVAMIVILGAAGSAAARDYSDAEHNLRLTVPEGWQTAQDSEKVITVFVTSPRIQETEAACAVVGEIDADTKDLSQADIDAGLDTSFNDAFWVQAFSDIKELSGFTVETSGMETVNGVKRYYAQVRYSEPGNTSEVVNTRSRQTLAFIPGWHYVIVCSALAASYEREEADFKTILASFAPLSTAPVASNAPSSPRSLTLYSQASFGGVSHVITQNTPNLALRGWNSKTASLSVGAGVWEICAAQDYRGRCRVVSAALPAGLGGDAVILSVRRATPSIAAASSLAAAQRATSRLAGH